MKKILFTFAVALFALPTTAVQAFDYCCEDYCDPCYDPCCYAGPFDGFYVGGNIGWGSNETTKNDVDGFFGDNSGWSYCQNGFVGGIQAGWDKQCGSKVFGLVTDFNGGTFSRTFNVDGTTSTIKSSLNWFGTIRARAGINVCDSLFYLTAGAAYANVETRWDNGTFDTKSSDTKWGWTGGVGTEYVICGNWTAGFELLYLYFCDSKKTFTTSASTPETFNFRHNDHMYLGRFTVNYRFGCR